jgi:HlyD family secretion protein
LGYRVQAKFLVGTREDKALIVPRFSVLQDSQGDYYVFVVKRNKIYKRVVRLGILTDEKVSILEGLSDKDIIVDQPTAEMQDGESVS